MDVRITAENDEIELRLDDTPIAVAYLDGEYHSQLANQFTGFPTMDALVDSLLETEGKTWTLHGGTSGGAHPHGAPNGGHGTGHGGHHGHEGGGDR
ncbi:hypothetical protein AQF52_6801 [Streptomyces venezuelae]|nr:hypothetical protein AQF52_6801 [Streptomyces venezuelae]